MSYSYAFVDSPVHDTFNHPVHPNPPSPPPLPAAPAAYFPSSFQPEFYSPPGPAARAADVTVPLSAQTASSNSLSLTNGLLIAILSLLALQFIITLLRNFK